MNEHLVVPEDRAGVELDEFLCLSFPEWSKRYVRRQVREGAVLLDGARVHPGQRVKRDQVVSIDIEDELEPPRPRTVEEPGIDVLYEDGDYLVVDKPADLAVEPDRWDPERPSLVGALAAHVQELAGEHDEVPFRPRIVHRIDSGTSGVVLVAKTLEAERLLGRAFRTGEVEKRYLALVEGEHPAADGEEVVCELPLGPDSRRSGRQVVRSDGKRARTTFRVERRYRGFTLLDCRLDTGRTHQIRVHLAEIGFPLVVDPLYGRRDALLLSEIKPDYKKKPGRPERPLIARPTLHAHELEVPPGPERLALGQQERLRFRAPLPRDFDRLLKQMAKVRAYRR